MQPGLILSRDAPWTAGYNAVNTASLTDFSLFITIILMFVGAFPVDAGGGVKTSAWASLILGVHALTPVEQRAQGLSWRTARGGEARGPGRQG
jgi:hypothetical protein